MEFNNVSWLWGDPPSLMFLYSHFALLWIVSISHFLCHHWFWSLWIHMALMWEIKLSKVLLKMTDTASIIFTADFFFSVLKSSAALRNYLRCSNKLWVTAEWRRCSSGGLYLQVDLRKQNLCVSWPLLQDELGGTHLKTPSVTNQNRGWGVGLTRNFSLIVKKCFPLNLTWEVGKVS